MKSMLSIIITISFLLDQATTFKPINDIQSIQIDHHSNIQSLSFNAFARDFELQLEEITNKLFSNNAHFIDHALNKMNHLNTSNAVKNCQFYHGLDTNDKSAIFSLSYCQNRGYHGHIMSDSTTFEITPNSNNNHHNIQIVETDIGQSDTFEPPFPELRRLSSSEHDNSTIKCDEQILKDNCAIIEMLIINGPDRVKLFQTQYGDNWQYELDLDIFEMISKAHSIYKGTKWVHEHDEFICFDIIIGGILRLEHEWFIDGKDYKPSNMESAPDYLRKTMEFVQDHYESNKWSYDATHVIIHQNWKSVRGVAYTRPGICDRSPYGTAGVITDWKKSSKVLSGLQMAITFSHELGHNLGLSHDMECDEKDFGFVMGYKKLKHRFSKCSMNRIWKINEENGYHCLYERHFKCHEFIDYNGQCGNGIIEGFERCEINLATQEFDDYCDESTCQYKAGRCPADEIFECIEVMNARDYILDKDNPRYYDGYYSSCVKQDQSDQIKPVVYERKDIGMIPLYLKQTEEVILRKSDCLIGGKKHGGWKLKGSMMGSKYTKSWIISIDDDDDTIDANLICAASNGMIFPNGVNEMNEILCDPNPLKLKSTPLIMTKLDNTSQCILSRQHEQCDDALNWDNVPWDVTISDAVEYDDLNGVYSQNGTCWHGMPEFHNDFMTLHFDLYSFQWTISYSDSKEIFFARCENENGDEHELFLCKAGMWSVNAPHDDQMVMEVDEKMNVNGMQSISDWFNGNRTLFKKSRPNYNGDEDDSECASFWCKVKNWFHDLFASIGDWFVRTFTFTSQQDDDIAMEKYV